MEMEPAFSRQADRKNARTSLARVLLHDGQIRLSWIARSTLSSKKIKLLAIGS
jgi:hypothetical protein